MTPPTPNTTPNPMNKQKPGMTSSTLLASGKSSRLLEMRNKSLNPEPCKAVREVVTPDSNTQDSALFIARQIIDRQLNAILSALPAGKQRSLFKIRYGIELEQLKQQPIKQIIRLLKIDHPQFAQPRGEMKRILDLTYNGQPFQ